ncbi:hypothetical protein [Actinomadura sp. CNU-125]|uniref:hypothetical protein n=1 Tax=Actinomadura sp. CNU-125 TaxID=1904961 RepID=UPI00117760D0|nr:hypothetical protein [Actinomadura sp. CNU-125]
MRVPLGRRRFADVLGGRLASGCAAFVLPVVAFQGRARLRYLAVVRVPLVRWLALRAGVALAGFGCVLYTGVVLGVVGFRVRRGYAVVLAGAFGGGRAGGCVAPACGLHLRAGVGVVGLRRAVGDRFGLLGLGCVVRVALVRGVVLRGGVGVAGFGCVLGAGVAGVRGRLGFAVGFRSVVGRVVGRIVGRVVRRVGFARFLDRREGEFVRRDLGLRDVRGDGLVARFVRRLVHRVIPVVRIGLATVALLFYSCLTSHTR